MSAASRAIRSISCAESSVIFEPVWSDISYVIVTGGVLKWMKSICSTLIFLIRIFPVSWLFLVCTARFGWEGRRGRRSRSWSSSSGPWWIGSWTASTLSGPWASSVTRSWTASFFRSGPTSISRPWTWSVTPFISSTAGFLSWRRSISGSSLKKFKLCIWTVRRVRINERSNRNHLCLFFQ